MAPNAPLGRTACGSRIARATASPARLELLDLLAQAPRTVEMLASFLEHPLANTSHHLKVLRQARLVETTRSGQFITYRLADASVADMLLQMRAIADARLTGIGAITRTYVERPRDRAVVAYCRGPYCVMSFDATALSRARGFAAHRLEAGVVEWRARARRGRATVGRTGVKRAASPATKRSARVAR